MPAVERGYFMKTLLLVLSFVALAGCSAFGGGAFPEKGGYPAEYYELYKGT